MNTMWNNGENTKLKPSEAEELDEVVKQYGSRADFLRAAVELMKK